MADREEKEFLYSMHDAGDLVEYAKKVRKKFKKLHPKIKDKNRHLASELDETIEKISKLSNEAFEKRKENKSYVGYLIKRNQSRLESLGAENAEEIAARLKALEFYTSIKNGIYNGFTASQTEKILEQYELTDPSTNQDFKAGHDLVKKIGLRDLDDGKGYPALLKEISTYRETIDHLNSVIEQKFDEAAPEDEDRIDEDSDKIDEDADKSETKQSSDEDAIEEFLEEEGYDPNSIDSIYKEYDLADD